MTTTPGWWTTPEFRDVALEWGMRALDREGLALRAWTQPHVRPWSTVLRLETDRDVFWLKGSGRGPRYEIGLLGVLADHDAPHVPRPVALDRDLGLVLMRDQGPTCRQAHGGATPLDVVERYLVAYAGLQRATASYVDELVAVGVPDLRPSRLPALLEAELDDLGRETGSCRLDPDDVARVRALLPAYADACAELDAGSVAPTVQHDDLHDANVLADGPTVVDWGDASVAHPFGTMLAALNSVAHHGSLAPDDPALQRLADAYTEAWSDVADLATRRRLVHLAQRTGVLAKSLSYRRALLDADDATLQQWGDARPDWVLEIFADDLPTLPPRLP